MKPVKVTCDSSCDLTAQLYQRYDITYIPMYIQLGDTRFPDQLDCDSLYAHENQCVSLPRAFAPSAEEYKQFFLQFTAQGFQVVHISTSAAGSQAFQNATAAADSLSDVFVIDSCALSAGAGHLAILGVELSHAGLDGAEIADALEDIKQQLDTSFLPSSLQHLPKSGLRTTLALRSAAFLQQNCSIQVQHGKISAGARFRGNWEDTIPAYLRSQLENKPNIQHDRLFLTHTGLAPGLLQKAVDLIRTLQPFDEIIITSAGCASACQFGPNCLGLHYLRAT